MMPLAHAVCALLSYVAFLIAFVSGVLFLLQEAQLKRKQMGVLFHRLPSLSALDRVNFLAIGLGFALLSVGVGLGFLSAGQGVGRWWDPKEWLVVAL